MRALALLTMAICLLPTTAFSHSNHEIKAADWVKLTILVDNHPYGELRYPWGLSIFVETQNTKFLWDTGPDPDDLIYNAKKLGINLRDIAFVAISHEHYDHIGGLPGIAAITGKKLKVYVPGKLSSKSFEWIKHMGLNPVKISHTKEVAEGVYIVGELYGPPYEGALAINLKGKGLLLLVGCSHPGVDKIARFALKELNTPIYAVIGGFHLLNSSHRKVKHVIENLISLGIKKIAAIHCSGDFTREFLKERYKSEYMELHVGSSLTLRD